MNNFLRLALRRHTRRRARVSRWSRRHHRRPRYLHDRPGRLDRDPLLQGRRPPAWRTRTRSAASRSTSVQLDDASDPSTGTRDARKLIERRQNRRPDGRRQHADHAGDHGRISRTESPAASRSLPGQVPGEPGSWMVSIPQPPPMMVEVVVNRMKAPASRRLAISGSTMRGATSSTTR